MLKTKGLPEFVEAVRRLNAEKTQARYVLVGDPDPDNPASVSESVPLEWANDAGVEYWGRRTDMPDVLRQADIVCLPSHREGMPKVLIEAASRRASTTLDGNGRALVLERFTLKSDIDSTLQLYEEITP